MLIIVSFLFFLLITVIRNSYNQKSIFEKNKIEGTPILKLAMVKRL